VGASEGRLVEPYGSRSICASLAVVRQLRRVSEAYAGVPITLDTRERDARAAMRRW
jgi:hypothetical protein